MVEVGLPMVSVIVPCPNEVDFIENTLKSICFGWAIVKDFLACSCIFAKLQFELYIMLSVFTERQCR